MSSNFFSDTFFFITNLTLFSDNLGKLVKKKHQKSNSGFQYFTQTYPALKPTRQTFQQAKFWNGDYLIKRLKRHMPFSVHTQAIRFQPLPTLTHRSAVAYFPTDVM